MKKFKNIFTLSVLALVGLSLTACSNDDLDTNPYNKSGVTIAGFGPSPILRTNEIRITGSNMPSVDKVVFPGENVFVEKANFNKVDDTNIYVNVPDESVPGHIKLVAGTDTATSVSLLTFEEPIEVTSVSPTSDINAGDEIVIKGDYVYNIAEVIFTCGVTGAPVAAEDFTYISRREIRLIVPLAAETGTITFNDGAEWEETYSTPLTINSATVNETSISSDFGNTIQITGTNLHIVESIMFPGGATSEFTVSDDHKTITTTVPEVTTSGSITLVLYSGASITIDSFTVPMISISEVSKFEDLRVGDEITVTGENFDRITSVTLPGIGEITSDQYTISGNTLKFTVPKEMADGNMELIQNSLIVVTHKLVMHSDAPEQAIWTGSFNCTGWAGNQDLAWGGFDWSTVAAGSKLRFYYKKNTAGSWGCISLRHGNNWGNLPDPIPGQYDLSDDEGVLEVVFTQNVLDDLIANGGLVITGDNYTLTRVAIPIPETVIWTGSFNCTGWAGNQDLAWGGFDWSTVNAGSKVCFTYAKNDAGAWGCISLRHGNNWGNLPDPIPGQYDLNDSEGVLEVVFPQNVLDDIIANGGLVITGDNYTLTKVVVR